VVSTSRQHSRRLLAWAGLALAIHLALAGLFLISHDNNPEWFIHFGRTTKAVELGREVLGPHVLVPQIDGHDGKEFWVLARDPLLLHPGVDRRTLDRPAYRAQRIAYPMLVAPWRLAGERALVWGMLITNLAAVAVGAYCTVRFAAHLSAPLRASLGFTLNPAVFVAVSLDVADAVALAALLWAMLSMAEGRRRSAVIAAVIACLAKEPMLLAFLSLTVLGTARDRRDWWRLVAIPAIAVAGWALYAHARLGFARSGSQEFAAPFTGYLYAYRHGWRPVGNWGDAAAAALVLAIGVAVTVRWWTRRSPLLTAALPFALLTPFLSGQVVDLADSSVRVVAPAITLLCLDAYSKRCQPRPAAVDLGGDQLRPV
jgi:hypothetical protein